MVDVNLPAANPPSCPRCRKVNPDPHHPLPPSTVAPKIKISPPKTNCQKFAPLNVVCMQALHFARSFAGSWQTYLYSKFKKSWGIKWIKPKPQDLDDFTVLGANKWRYTIIWWWCMRKFLVISDDSRFMSPMRFFQMYFLSVFEQVAYENSARVLINCPSREGFLGVPYNPIFWSKKTPEKIDQPEPQNPSANITSQKKHWRQIDRNRQTQIDTNLTCRFHLGLADSWHFHGKSKHAQREKCQESARKVPWKRHESAMNLPWICHASAMKVFGKTVKISSKKAPWKCHERAMKPTWIWHIAKNEAEIRQKKQIDNQHRLFG